MYIALDSPESLLLPKIPSIKRRAELELAGGTLPVYVTREEDAIVGFGKKDELACFYCGFGKEEGHDYACRYLWWMGGLNEQKFHGNVYIDVPKGGVKPSKSYF